MKPDFTVPTGLVYAPASECVHAHKRVSARSEEDVLAVARLRQTATGRYLRRPLPLDVRSVRGADGSERDTLFIHATTKCQRSTPENQVRSHRIM